MPDELSLTATERASVASEPRERSEPAKRLARERVGGPGAKPLDQKNEARAPDILGPLAPPVAAPEESQACDFAGRRAAG